MPQDDPWSLIRVILAGARLASLDKAPFDLGMPGFAWRLSDEGKAHLATLVRNAWGDKAPPVDAAKVAEVPAVPEVPQVRKLLKEGDIHKADESNAQH